MALHIGILLTLSLAPRAAGIVTKERVSKEADGPLSGWPFKSSKIFPAPIERPVTREESKVLKSAQKALSRGPPQRKIWAFPLHEFAPKEGHAGLFVEFGFGLQSYPDPKQWWELPQGKKGTGGTLGGWDAMELMIPIKAAVGAVGAALTPVVKLAARKKGWQWPNTPHLLSYGDWRFTDSTGRLFHLRLGYKFANGIKIFSKNLIGDPLGKDQWWKFLEVGAEFVHKRDNTETPAADKNGWTFKVKHGYTPAFHSKPKESPRGDSDHDMGPMAWYAEAGYGGSYEKPVAPVGHSDYFPGGTITVGDSWQNFDKIRYVTYEGNQKSSSVSAGYFEETDHLWREWNMPQILSMKYQNRVLSDYYKLATMKRVQEQTAYYDELCLDDTKAENMVFKKHGPCERWNLDNFMTGDMMFFGSEDAVSFVVRSWTNSDLHHSTMVVWFEFVNGGWESRPKRCPNCLITLLEMTSYPSVDVITGVEDAGYMVRHLFNKVGEQGMDTRVFVKHRSEALSPKQMKDMNTLMSCLYTRRPLYLYGMNSGEPKTGMDGLLTKGLYVNEKITNPGDATFERALCSSMTAFFVEMWNEAPLIFEYEEGNSVNGLVVQTPTREKVDKKGNVKKLRAIPLLPLDFSPQDLGYMTMQGYEKIKQVERPWHGFKRFRKEILEQEAILRSHPEKKNWKQLAGVCLAGLDDLKFIKDFMPEWKARMENVAKSVVEGNIAALDVLGSEEAVIGWKSEVEDDAEKDKVLGNRRNFRTMASMKEA